MLQEFTTKIIIIKGYSTILKPMIALLLNMVLSGTPPRKSFLGLLFISGLPYLIKPTTVFIVLLQV